MGKKRNPRQKATQFKPGHPPFFRRSKSQTVLTETSDDICGPSQLRRLSDYHQDHSPSGNLYAGLDCGEDSSEYNQNDLDSSETDEELASRFVKNLKFRNPGKFMEDFDPENSSREMRKLNRRIYRETVRKNQVYDDRGKLLTDSRDLCDCLAVRCPGCHFPCPKCSSTKCGGDCRCNRRWHYTEVEVEGTATKVFSSIS